MSQRSFDPATVPSSRWLAGGGALVLLISLFLDWFGAGGYSERDHQMVFLQVDPRLDPVRSSAVMTRLLEEMGLGGGARNPRFVSP